MRHADSENFWRVKDHERPITEEGRKSAFKVCHPAQHCGLCLYPTTAALPTLQQQDKLKGVALHGAKLWHRILHSCVGADALRVGVALGLAALSCIPLCSGGCRLHVSCLQAAVSCKVAWAAHWLPSGLDSFKSLIRQPVSFLSY